MWTTRYKAKEWPSRKTPCKPEQLEFQGFGRRTVVVTHDAGATSSDGGLILLQQLEERYGILGRLERCFRDGRNARLVTHPLSTLLKQRVFGICQGYEDLNDHEQWRNDPRLSALCGNEGGNPVAGKSTLNRLELGKEVGTAYGRRYSKIRWNDDEIADVFVDLFLNRYRRAPKEMVLDVDATDDPLHGNQEGRFFHGYYDEYCYLLLYVFCGPYLLTAKLRSADHDASAGAREVVQHVVAKIRARFPKVRIVLRGDSGFCREALMGFCERTEGMFYLFGLAKNTRLLRAAGRYRHQAERQYRATGEHQRVFADMVYRTKDSWSRTRRVVVKAEYGEKGANPRFMETSLPGEEWQAQALYEDLYCARGDMENRVKEQQPWLFADRTSTGWFSSNQLRLWLSSIAYWFFVVLREEVLRATDVFTWQTGTIRLKLLNVSAIVKVTARRVWISLPSAFPYWELWAEAAEKLRPA